MNGSIFAIIKEQSCPIAGELLVADDQGVAIFEMLHSRVGVWSARVLQALLVGSSLERQPFASVWMAWSVEKVGTRELSQNSRTLPQLRAKSLLYSHPERSFAARIDRAALGTEDFGHREIKPTAPHSSPQTVE